MKKLLLLFTLSILSTPLYAQKGWFVNPFVSYTQTDLKGEFFNTPPEGYQPKLNGGMDVLYNFTEKHSIGLASGIHYTHYQVADQNLHVQYLSLPLQLSYTSPKLWKFRIYGKGGIRLGRIMKGRMDYIYDGMDPVISSQRFVDSYSRYSVGSLLEAGLLFQLTKRLAFNFGGMYEEGLTKHKNGYIHNHPDRGRGDLKDILDFNYVAKGLLIGVRINLNK